MLSFNILTHNLLWMTEEVGPLKCCCLFQHSLILPICQLRQRRLINMLIKRFHHLLKTQSQIKYFISNTSLHINVISMCSFSKKNHFNINENIWNSFQAIFGLKMQTNVGKVLGSSSLRKVQNIVQVNQEKFKTFLIFKEQKEYPKHQEATFQAILQVGAGKQKDNQMPGLILP